MSESFTQPLLLFLIFDIPSTTVGIHQRRDAPVDFTNFCSLLILIAVAYCDCDMESHGPHVDKAAWLMPDPRAGVVPGKAAEQ